MGTTHISAARRNDYNSGTSLSLTADGTVAGPTSGSRYDFRNWTGDVASLLNAS